MLSSKAEARAIYLDIVIKSRKSLADYEVPYVGKITTHRVAMSIFSHLFN